MLNDIKKHISLSESTDRLIARLVASWSGAIPSSRADTRTL